MNKNKKSILLFGSFLLITILLTTFISLHYAKNISFFDYDIKYVDEIESDLYEKVKLYKFNSINNNYDINEIHLLKDDLFQQVFYYYNNDLKYYVNELNHFDNTVYIKLQNNDEELNLLVFKLMKLSYESLNIEKLVINYNNEEYIIK